MNKQPSSIQELAIALKVPRDMLAKVMADVGYDKAKDEPIDPAEMKALKRKVSRAYIRVRRSENLNTVAVPTSKVSPAVAVAPSISRDAPNLLKMHTNAVLREKRQREEETVHARDEAEKHTAEIARKLATEQISTEPSQAKTKPIARAPRRRAPPRQPRQSHQKTKQREQKRHLNLQKPHARRSKNKDDDTPALFQARNVEVPEFIQISDLAHRMSAKVGLVIEALRSLGVIATATQIIDQETAELAVAEMGHNAQPVHDREVEERLEKSLKTESAPIPRPPVVTVMGHVNHGKTTLLDKIRKTKVADSEFGGITQHIGAYQVSTPSGMATFIDTPGHAAFTGLRARGAIVTDLVVLVVAADDGVMPQTREAIEHGTKAEIPFIVAINKMDSPRANAEKIRQQLAEAGVAVEGWGGDVQAVEISASKNEGIDKLLEVIMLEAEVREFKAVPDGPAQGVVLEATMRAGRGPVATLLIQRGSLNTGDILLLGTDEMRVRSLSGDDGTRLQTVTASMPVEVLGFSSVPEVGMTFTSVPDSRLRKEVLEYRTRAAHGRKAVKEKVSLDSFFDNVEEGKKLNLVLKVDVRGSLEAIRYALAKLGNDKLSAQIVSCGIGAISESDVNLAHSIGSTIIGFHVRADAQAQKTARELGTEIRYYSTIYELIEDVEKAMVGLLEPELREEIIGTAEVKEVFTASGFGLIAGSVVAEGVVRRQEPVRVLRDNVVIFEGALSSLRRFKDNVDEVREGMDCGIGIKDYKDIRAGDCIEVYSVRTVPATLESATQ